MKVVVLTAVWKRRELFKIFLDGFNRIKDNTEHELILVTVGSEGKKFSNNHLESPNFPLSTKWQNGVDYVKELDPDYVLMLGSDDLICSNLLDVYTQEMNKGTELIGLIDCYFLDSRNNEFTHWLGYRNHRRGESIGMARMLSKGLLEKIGWRVWAQPANRGLDSIMMKRLRTIKHTQKMFDCKKEKILAVDVKTDTNVSKINTYKNLRREDINGLSKYISEKEFYKLIELK